MYIHRTKTTNKKTGKEYFSVFLCSKYRESGKIKTRTEANLSLLPEYVVLIAELNNIKLCELKLGKGGNINTVP